MILKLSGERLATVTLTPFHQVALILALTFGFLFGPAEFALKSMIVSQLLNG